LQNTTHAIINNTRLVSKANIVFPLKVKNEPRDGEMEHAFILGSMDCTVMNNHDATKENLTIPIKRVVYILKYLQNTTHAIINNTLLVSKVNIQ
jgi:hypothetical protein